MNDEQKELSTDILLDALCLLNSLDVTLWQVFNGFRKGTHPETDLVLNLLNHLDVIESLSVKKTRSL